MSDNTPAGAQPTPPPPAGYPGAQPPAYGASAPAPAPGYGAPAAPGQGYPAQGYPASPPAYGAAPQYPAPGYGGYPVGPKTNVLAIISMIASIAGIVWVLPFIGSLAGAIMGHISLNQLKTSGEKGRGMALTGVILGWIGLGLSILGAIVFFALIAVAAQNGARYSS